LSPIPLKPHEVLWETVLETNLGLKGGEDVTTLRGCRNSVKDMTEGDMQALVNGLLSLRQDVKDNPAYFAGKRLFDVSAQYLLGSSKLLRSLPGKVLTDFGIPVDRLLGPPRYVLVAGAESPEATILVENPHSFEAAVKADKECRFCWIATYGYGLSKSDESYGDQMVNIVSQYSPVITLSRRPYYTEFKQAIEAACNNLFFWGDLDLAGLDIYGRLKQFLPALKLSRLYQPMVEELQRGGGHSYQSAQKERQSLGDFPFEEIHELSKICASVALDQEFVEVEKNLSLSGSE
jgi:hypothetical protein